ncbi:MAG: DNA-binding protein Alba [Nanoarchaeota archaeon]|nr:DNA-binding protein Alba [Nanoarchaeota archaeon]
MEQNENVIFVGAKPFINYIKGVTMQFTSKNKTEVIIKARGKFISKAVDLAEVIKKKFSENPKAKVKNIKIDSDDFENKDGRKVKVSEIEITIMRK